MVEVRLDGALVCARCALAEKPTARLRGLLGRRSLGSHEGLLLTPARSVHTAFMRFPIDALFLDRELRVLAVVRLGPWRVATRARARAVLELAVGEAEQRGIRPGARLTLRPAQPGQAAGAT
jgi:uncharacterized membrane protein (UPF0127 family)